MTNTIKTREQEGQSNNFVDVNNVMVGMPLMGGLWVSKELLTEDQYPIDANTELNPELWSPTGYVGEDGVNENQARSSEKVRAWGSDTIRTLQTEHDLTYTFSLVETYNALVLELLHGKDNVNVDNKGNFSIDITSEVLPKLSWCIEVKDGDKKVRVFIPNANITETGEITYVHSDVIKYEVTLEAFPVGEKKFKARKFIGDFDAGLTPPVENPDKSKIEDKK